jgi:cellulose synthase/poly-beta-1,6-N-acetylglucosamine synthase-like glycosyltransferase
VFWLDWLFILPLSFQIFFLLFCYWALSQSQHPKNTPTPQPVSVIICAHNAAHFLQKLLPALFEQAHPVFEVILVIDRSTDSTLALAQYWASQEKRLRYHCIETIPIGIQPKKYALMQGIQIARYEYLLLTDADCVPASSQWIGTMQAAFQPSTNFVLGVSLYEDNPSWLSKVVGFETLMTALYYLSFAKAGLPYMGIGRNLAYRRSFFLEKGGFSVSHLSVVGGDDDLWVGSWANSQNTQVCMHPTALTYSQLPNNWQHWYRQKIRHLSVGRHYKIKFQLLLACCYGSHTFAILGWLWLLLATAPLAIGITLVLRSILVVWIYTYCLDLFSRKTSYLWLVIGDILFPFYLTIIGIIARLKQHIQWH